jgi:hypothetical protein
MKEIGNQNKEGFSLQYRQWHITGCEEAVVNEGQGKRLEMV